MLDIKQIYNFEWKFLGVILLISGIGILTIFSATYGFAPHSTPYYQKQLYWIAIGLMFLFIAATIDYHTIIKNAYVIYLFFSALGACEDCNNSIAGKILF